MQNCENWKDDGTIRIIVNHNVDENSNVNNFDERIIAEENGQIFSKNFQRSKSNSSLSVIRKSSRKFFNVC